MRVFPHEWTPMRIRELRVRFGDTQVEFAERVTGLRIDGGTTSPNRIARWENGHATPSLEFVALLRRLDAMAPKVQFPHRLDDALLRGVYVATE